jgi:hypothetical protein
VISEVVYDGRDKKEGEITWKFRPLPPIKTGTLEAPGFDECQSRRPEGHASENSKLKNNLGILDLFPFRLRGDELVLGVLEPLVPRPARVAQDLALALQLQAEIDREGLTYRELAERHGWSRMKAYRLLPLARLAPDIQAEVAQLTTTVAGEPIDRDTLLWITEAPDWSSQRKRFDALARAWRMLITPTERVA